MKLIYKATKDGSFTLYDQFLCEHHHSLIGAYTEARYKYVEPARIIFNQKLNQGLSKEKKTIKVLDVPFGIGYNSIATIKYLEENQSNYLSDFKLEILAIENNKEVIQKIKSFSQFSGSELSDYFKLISSLSEKSLLKNENLRYLDFQIELLEKDLFQILPVLANSKYQNYFDLVYFDPFSFRNRPEFWSKQKVLFFISKLLNDSGLFITYSSSKKVRKALLELDLQISPSFPVGRKSPGTLAFKKRNLSLSNLLTSFDQELLERINKESL